MKPTIDHTFADNFAGQWLSAWNDHDIERILDHYTDDFEMSSPVVVQITGNLEGKLQGKAAIRAYWSKALAHYPNLRFTPICTLLGVNSIAIHYLGATGKLVIEVFSFDEGGMVYKAHAHYQA